MFAVCMHTLFHGAVNARGKYVSLNLRLLVWIYRDTYRTLMPVLAKSGGSALKCVLWDAAAASDIMGGVASLTAGPTLLPADSSK